MKTTKYDYTFLFESIQNRSTQVTLLTHQQNKKDSFTVSINDKSLLINGLPTVPSISADLLDLAIAVHAADRLIKRNTNTPLSFRVKLPVRNFDTFVRSDVYGLLTSVLEWYTNDCWHFEFSKRELSGRDVEIQAQLPWDIPPSNIEIALWSGGLDSLSGLSTRLLSNSESYHVLVGTGSNSYVLKRQRRIASEVNRLITNRTSLIQIPYRWHKTPLLQKNFSQRSRGFVFMLIGAACAHHMKCNSLFIYENGIGAINLPYSKAEVGLDQAKSVHPLSLLRVGKLVSSIVGVPFKFVNPFWLQTKAQMNESLFKEDLVELITLSSSCDRIHRLKKGITQCGVCTSCLLRRQSLTVLGLDDSASYKNKYINKDSLHLNAMQYQVNRMRNLLKQDNPWVSLSGEYHDLDDIADQISTQNGQEVNYLRRQIIQLYSNYADEWKLFENYVEGTVPVM